MFPSEIHWTRSYTEFSISQLKKAITWLEACNISFPEAGYQEVVENLKEQKEKLGAILAGLPRLR